jgi:hypothetical protein
MPRYTPKDVGFGRDLLSASKVMVLLLNWSRKREVICSESSGSPFFSYSNISKLLNHYEGKLLCLHTA